VPRQRWDDGLWLRSVSTMRTQCAPRETVDWFGLAPQRLGLGGVQSSSTEEPQARGGVVGSSEGSELSPSADEVLRVEETLGLRMGNDGGREKPLRGSSPLVQRRQATSVSGTTLLPARTTCVTGTAAGRVLERPTPSIRTRR
jgi:hypothetical protein